MISKLASKPNQYARNRYFSPMTKILHYFEHDFNDSRIRVFDEIVYPIAQDTCIECLDPGNYEKGNLKQCVYPYCTIVFHRKCNRDWTTMTSELTCRYHAAELCYDIIFESGCTRYFRGMHKRHLHDGSVDHVCPMSRLNANDIIKLRHFRPSMKITPSPYHMGRWIIEIQCNYKTDVFECPYIAAYTTFFAVNRDQVSIWCFDCEVTVIFSNMHDRNGWRDEHNKRHLEYAKDYAFDLMDSEEARR